MPPQDYWLFFVAALAGVFRFWRKRRAVGKGGIYMDCTYLGLVFWPKSQFSGNMSSKSV